MRDEGDLNGGVARQSKVGPVVNGFACSAALAAKQNKAMARELESETFVKLQWAAFRASKM